MGNPKGFMTISRKSAGYRPQHERVKDYSEVEQVLDEETRLRRNFRYTQGVLFITVE